MVCKNKLYSSPNRNMIAIGMVLFLFCDINVLLYNLMGMISSSSEFIKQLYNISSVSMWLFYLPSQILLSLSGYNFSTNRKLFYSRCD